MREWATRLGFIAATTGLLWVLWFVHVTTPLLAAVGGAVVIWSLMELVFRRIDKEVADLNAELLVHGKRLEELRNLVRKQRRR